MTPNVHVLGLEQDSEVEEFLKKLFNSAALLGFVEELPVQNANNYKEVISASGSSYIEGTDVD